jgi:hypothetical protein
MKLEEIEKLWDVDSKIDDTAYDIESNKIPQLHSKYFKILNQEKIRLKQTQYAYKKLTLEKYEFLQAGPDKRPEKFKDKSWQFPSNLIIMKGDYDKYIDADPEVANMNYKIEHIKIKIEFLESIIDNLNRRSFSIKNSIEWNRFINGG